MSVLQSKRRAVINEPHKESKTELVCVFDKAEYAPMGVVANFTPVQDLHGQASPYPAGGGKNLFDESTLYHGAYNASTGELSSESEAYRTVVIDNLSAGTYTFSTNLTDCYVVRIWKVDTNTTIGATTNTRTFTMETSGKFMLCFRNTSTSDITETVHVQIEAGNDATPYAPYSNICPISGWTGCNVTRTGVNVWDEEWGAGTINNEGKNASSTTAIRTKNYIPIKPGTTYYLQSPKGVIGKIYDINKNFLGNTGRLDGEFIFNDESVAYLRFVVTNTTVYGNNISINYPSADHDYHAYSGNTYNVDWTDEAGTVYGGSLDVAKGVLTATWGNIASYNGETLSGRWLSDRDVYAAGTTPTTGAQVCYELATPITYTLTPTQIKSLRGKNNVWTDMNAPTDVSAWVH